MPRDFARVALGLFTKRKNRTRKLILAQGKKKVTWSFFNRVRV